MEEKQIEGASNYWVRPDGTIYNSKTGNVILGAKHGNGYLTVYLRMDTGQRKKFYMHRLVAYAFVPNPHNYPFIDHLDHTRDNNVASNLEWVTNAENVQRGYNFFNYKRKTV